MPIDALRARDLFLAALDLRDEDRTAFLLESCGTDVDLRAEVESLLAAHLRPAHRLLRRPPVADGILQSFMDGERRGPASAKNSVPFPPGTRIAERYTIRELIGEGSMGSVYHADQTEPVKRPVALKVIKLGMDTKSVLTRFGAERQTLALMDHPNIARVFDGGMTQPGQPFFVMELVNGTPITKYCDEHRLPVRARLELFTTVCEAVQHAHQKGVIHRDLKPGNVLVSQLDGRAAPKVIDFGIAKATDRKTADPSCSESGRIVGTPAYMSPEQAGSVADVDTRTDVYALGAILYELLTGSPPLETKQLRQSTVTEMFRAIREADPPRPSVKIRTSDPRCGIATNRHTTTADLQRSLRGDLDWIIVKSLEKDRTRRYESASALAADIHRHLRCEPVLAAPQSPVYLAIKFARRNRTAVVAGAAVVMAVVAGITGITISMLQTDAARRSEEMQRLEAEAKQRDAETAQRQAIDARSEALLEAKRANDEAEAAKQFAGFLVGLFESQDPLAIASANLGFRNQQRNTLLAHDLLTRGLARLNSPSGLKQRPIVRAMLLHELAMIYFSLGGIEDAKPLADESLAIRRSLLLADHSDLIKSVCLVAQIQFLKGDLQSSLSLFREAHSVLEGRPAGSRRDLAEVKASLGMALFWTDKSESYRLLRQAHEMLEKEFGRSDIRTLSSGFLLAVLHAQQNNFVQSGLLAVEMLADLESSSASPELKSTIRLAVQTVLDRKSEGSLNAWRKLVGQLVQVFGDHHFLTYWARFRLAGLLYDARPASRSQHAEAAELYEKMLNTGPRVGRGQVLLFLAKTRIRLDEVEEGEKQLLHAIEEADRMPREFRDAILPVSLKTLAGLYSRLDQPEKVAKIDGLLSRAVDAARSNPRTNPSLMAKTLLDLGHYRLSLGQATSSIDLFVEAEKIRTMIHGTAAIETIEVKAFRESALRKSNRLEEAANVRTEVLYQLQASSPPAGPTVRIIRDLLDGRVPVWQSNLPRVPKKP